MVVWDLVAEALAGDVVAALVAALRAVPAPADHRLFDCERDAAYRRACDGVRALGALAQTCWAAHDAVAEAWTQRVRRLCRRASRALEASSADAAELAADAAVRAACLFRAHAAIPALLEAEAQARVVVVVVTTGPSGPDWSRRTFLLARAAAAASIPVIAQLAGDADTAQGSTGGVGTGGLLDVVLHQAARHGRLDVLEWLFQLHPWPVPSPHGWLADTTFRAMEAAARNGHQAVVLFFLQRGVDVNWYSGRCLASAVERCRADMIPFLQRCGADVRIGNDRALRSAASVGWLDGIDTLLAAGADPRTRATDETAVNLGGWVRPRSGESEGLDDRTLETACMAAYIRADAAVVQRLVQHPSCTLEALADDLSTVLRLYMPRASVAVLVDAIVGKLPAVASAVDHAEADVLVGQARALYASGAPFRRLFEVALDDPNMRSGPHPTQHMERVRLAVAIGIDVLVPEFQVVLERFVLGVNVDGVRLVTDASVNGCNAQAHLLALAKLRLNPNHNEHVRAAEIARLLIAAGADPAANRSEALRAAWPVSKVEVFRVLAEAGAEVAALGAAELCRLAAGTTQYDTLDRICLLLDHGADLALDNHMALRMAVLAGNLKVTRLLLDRGADVHACNDEAIRTALRNDTLGRHEARQLVELLLERGADPAAVPAAGWVPAAEVEAERIERDHQDAAAAIAAIAAAAEELERYSRQPQQRGPTAARRRGGGSNAVSLRGAQSGEGAPPWQPLNSQPPPPECSPQ